MNLTTISCDVCGHFFDVSIPIGRQVEHFRTIERIGDFGIVGALLGMSCDRKVRCPECGSITGIKYERMRAFQ